MLQQTQVATVIPYYLRFVTAFPTIKSLAAADEQTLLAHWEGLGYYRRARSLHAAAKQIVNKHDGEFPTAFDDVIALPGVGRYTAGAVLSISRDARHPILEGNTQRVFSRWVAMRGAATDSAATKLLWQIAESMLPRKNSGAFNQAAMELGAMICVPGKPSCDRCPVARECRAHAAGLEAEIPGKVSKMVYQDRIEYALVIANRRVRSQTYLMRPLPEGARWAGLWDFPRTTEDSLESLSQAEHQLSKDLGVDVSAGMRLKTIRHAVTKYRITLHVHVAELTDPTSRPRKPWRYVSTDEMASLPMSVSGRKIAGMIARESQARLPL